MSFKDRTNIRYGKLVAIEYLGKSMWRCQCDCGNIKQIYGGHLENGHTKSCGCATRPPRKNLINQKFGRLTVFEWAGQGKWKCKCDCGKQIEVITNNLINGNTKSCGCYQRDRASEVNYKSLIGQRFGKLLVLERVQNNRFGHVQYKCKCDCGGITITQSNRLCQGRVNSCGCIKSKGQTLINLWLQQHNIDFISQYSLEEIKYKSGRHPFFDFAIFKDKQLYCLLEYDGQQHFKSGSGWNTEENFLKTQARDKEKDQICQNLGIKLYRISYNEDLYTRLESIFL